MTDRLKGCWVAFDHDIRTDDAEPLLDAIRQLRGVAGVEPIVANSNDWMARTKVAISVQEELLAVFEKLREP